MKQFAQALERAGVAVEWKVEEIGFLVKSLYYTRFIGVPIIHLNTFLLSLRLRKAVSRLSGRKALLITEPLTAIALWRSPVPVAYWCISGVVEWWHLQSRVETGSVILSSAMEVVAARAADMVISESQRIGSLLGRAARVPVSIIPWGVDSDVFTPAKKESGPGLMTILFAGMIRDAKGVDTLVDACCTLANDFPVRLVIVGRVLPAWLKFVETMKDKAARAGLRLEFPGYMGWDKLSVLMASSDVLVMPSRHEGLANVVLEAMASGIPVVSSRVAGMPEVIEKNACGLIFEAGDVNSLVRQLRQLLSDSQLRSTLGTNGRKAAVESYSWDSIAKCMIRSLGLNSATDEERTPSK